ncbi:dipeptide epimerase [Aegicerativicinus sediminis]|uniref:dipeptide epimerase n=1 Tax=Aegicerativicinus sediminis TaxID=2893202 RepID=UPI001E3D83E1|nr:dipeptide epimerase [Aegicerativicinus sediminis]
MELQIKKFNLQLKHTFTISRESHDFQPSLIVVLSMGGHTGYGETTANPYYKTTLESLEASINKARPFIEGLQEFINPELFWKEIKVLVEDDMFALCALDLAYWDLFTQHKGLKLYEYWKLDPSQNPMTNYTIGIDTVEKMVQKITEFKWPIYKIKLGTDKDLDIVRELRKHTNARFRVDANCGWTVNQTIENSEVLKALGVEFIEQPLPANNWKGHREVFLNSELPIIADESCLVEGDVDKCHEHFHGINVKLVKCGGLTAAYNMLNKARAFGMKTMVGCMTESTVGISAIAHLLPLLNYVDMDGPLLLAKDIADGVTFEEGVIHYSDRPGIGAVLYSE